MMNRAGVFSQPKMQVDPMKDSRIRCLRFLIWGKNSARLIVMQLQFVVFSVPPPILTNYEYTKSLFSLQPLLTKDGLLIPTLALMVLYVVAYISLNGDLGLSNSSNPRSKLTIVTVSTLRFPYSLFIHHFYTSLSLRCMVV